jgi:integrase
VRIFARYRHATDSCTEIPPDGLLPYRPKRALPYLYSDAEIHALLHAALHMPSRYERGKLRPWVYYCLFGLLSVSGLRLGEARNLELHDVDLKAAVLTIRGAKFGKTRLVPVHAPASGGARQCDSAARSAGRLVTRGRDVEPKAPITASGEVEGSRLPIRVSIPMGTSIAIESELKHDVLDASWSLSTLISYRISGSNGNQLGPFPGSSSGSTHRIIVSLSGLSELTNA